MATHHPIAPFPGDLDRDAFGHWLSGFVDGEGCFFLSCMRKRQRERRTPCAVFKLSLRSDDAEVLSLIRSFWGVGNILATGNARSKTRAKPATIYTVGCAADQERILVPHFDRYPLRAKKRNDFLIWKDAVQLIMGVKGRRGRRKWSAAEYARFRNLHDALRHQRKFSEGPVAAPATVLAPTQVLLFDALDATS